MLFVASIPQVLAHSFTGLVSYITKVLTLLRHKSLPDVDALLLFLHCSRMYRGSAAEYPLVVTTLDVR